MEVCTLASKFWQGYDTVLGVCRRFMIIKDIRLQLRVFVDHTHLHLHEVRVSSVLLKGHAYEWKHQES